MQYLCYTLEGIGLSADRSSMSNLGKVLRLSSN